MKLTSLTSVPTQSVSHNPEIKKWVLLDSTDLPHLTNFSQARFAPGQVANGHRHGDMYEVFFVESGTGQMLIDGTPYPLEPGTCIAVEPGETHEVINSGTIDLVLTYFGVAA
jgi:mannose-6-phosphate isomerase-like protein (cupin superfamily)